MKIALSFRLFLAVVFAMMTFLIPTGMHIFDLAGFYAVMLQVFLVITANDRIVYGYTIGIALAVGCIFYSVFAIASKQTFTAFDYSLFIIEFISISILVESIFPLLKPEFTSTNTETDNGI